jgi:hypothetical protein
MNGKSIEDTDDYKSLINMNGKGKSAVFLVKKMGEHNILRNKNWIVY